MRLFVSTGEASGELIAADLLGALRARVPVQAEGIGDTRLEAAGVRIVQRTRGWASLGPIAALRKIVPLWLIMARTALRLRRDPPDGEGHMDRSGREEPGLEHRRKGRRHR